MRRVSLLVSVLLLALASAAACLPDLAIAQPPPFCGDGLIDPDAGEECDPGDAGSAAHGCSVGCRVACTEKAAFVDGLSHHCYFSAGFTSDIDAAGAACESSGAHVVRFVSAGEIALIANDSPTGDLWVGLRRDSTRAYRSTEPSNEPGWRADCTGCFAPNALDGGGNCVSLQTTPPPVWMESVCAGGKTFSHETVCEREPVGSRARPCNGAICMTVAATEASKRYVLVPTLVGANDAVQTCIGYGGRLVVFESREEREQLAGEIANQTLAPDATRFWIGLSNASGAWQWDPPGPAGVDVWGAGQPSPGVSAGRAYVVLDRTLFDTALARAGDATDAGGEAHYVVCQL